MRKGVLLSEAPPLEIMASCNADTLESAFLILSQNQTSGNTEVIVEYNLFYLQRRLRHLDILKIAFRVYLYGNITY